jgi:dienelactone hydrolase
MPMPYRDVFVTISTILIVSLSLSAAPAYPDRKNLLVVRDGDTEKPIRTTADWARRREHILANVQEVMGPLPPESEKVPLEWKVESESMEIHFIRKKVSYAVEKGERISAWLLIPRGRSGKRPAMLCLHQTIAIGKDEPAGLGKNENLAYAVHLARRGYVTLSPDYPSFGEYPYDFRKSKFASGSMKAIWNNRRAIDLLVELPEVDAERIGCIGHSLGGHNTIFTTLFEPRIRVAISNCGFNSFPKYKDGNLAGWSSDRYMPRIASLYGARAEKMPFDFPELIAALSPRPFRAIAPLHDDNFEVSGVRDCITAATPVYELLGAKEKLSADYPDCKHEFPPAVRQAAYDWLDTWLKP